MAINETENPWLLAGEVARFLNVHINTVRRWSNLGLLEAHRIGNRGDRRFRKNDVDRLIVEQQSWPSIVSKRDSSTRTAVASRNDGEVS